jgi:hypothetical protein
VSAIALVGWCFGCSASGKDSKTNPGGGGGHSSTGATSNIGGDLVFGGNVSIGGLGVGGEETTIDDVPSTCEQAALKRTYMGCDFWPTITYNPVYTDFDFAVVIANSNGSDAMVTVTGPNSFSATDTVPANGLKAITLPWVDALKGPEFSRANTSEGRAKDSVRVDGGAYHVVASIPVTAWQFNPLQYSKPMSGITKGCGTT